MYDVKRDEKLYGKALQISKWTRDVSLTNDFALLQNW